LVNIWLKIGDISPIFVLAYFNKICLKIIKAGFKALFIDKK
jgi:hypothetical protein